MEQNYRQTQKYWLFDYREIEFDYREVQNLINQERYNMFIYNKLIFK